jgi:hypothetical protein
VQRGLLDLGASRSFVIKGCSLIWAGERELIWYPWFGIAGLHWCSYGASDERKATRKVMYVGVHVQLPPFLPCAALLPPVHQFRRPGYSPFSGVVATTTVALFSHAFHVSPNGDYILQHRR